MPEESQVQPPQEQKVTFDEKSRLERSYRALLVDDLLNSRTKFSAGPYEAHIQFSNFCNMSCIMCWNGENPPTKKTDPELLKRIGEQVGPHLSIVTPYSGSEPLILTWEQTREMAVEYGILLCITTNLQFLDEAKFHELKDVTETLILSIDSHIPEVFEKIRPRSNSKKVFANLATTARLSAEHNLECMVNIVFMTQNAPMLTDTLNYLADLGIQNVNIIQMLDVNGNSGMYDPLLHYSQDYIAWVKRNSIATAKQRKFRLIWSIAGYAEFDFREPGFVPLKPRKAWNDDWDERMKRLFPRFCRNAYGRLRIDSEGDVSPCCYATQGELSLGNLNEADFDDIWNSTEAQDLRRGMFSGDVPALCQSCRYHDLVDPFFTLPFIETEEAEFFRRHNIEQKPSIASLEIAEPKHGLRTETPIRFSIVQPGIDVKEYVLAISLGGETDEVYRESVEPVSCSGGLVSFEFPVALWESLNTNVGYWWMIWAISSKRNQSPLRCEQTRCIIRHESIPRLEGSSLRYRDQGFVPVSDLGGTKRAGWQDPIHLPARPVAAFHGRAQHEQASPHAPLPIAPIPTAPLPTAPIPIARIPIARIPNASQPTSKNSRDENSRKPSGSPTPAGIKDAYVEVVSQKPNSIWISGWILLTNSASEQIEIVNEAGDAVTASAYQRDDIASAFPEIESARNAGFEVNLPDEMFWQTDRYQFAIVARHQGRVAFRCQVSCRGGQDGVGKAHSIRRGVLDL